MNDRPFFMYVPPMSWAMEQRIREMVFQAWLVRNYSPEYLRQHYPWLDRKKRSRAQQLNASLVVGA